MEAKQLLQNILEEAKKEILQIEDQQILIEVKSKYLGKKSVLGEMMKDMGKMDEAQKKEFGQIVNWFKESLEEVVTGQRKKLIDLAIAEKLQKERIDVTLPGKEMAIGSRHLLRQTTIEIEDIFIGMGYTIASGPEVELDLYNFEMLNLPKDHPARDMQDSFYIDSTHLLRTHTSPVQARTMLANPNKPIMILCPGKVYRRDDDDATHSHQFMQFEGLVVGKEITMSDLRGTLTLFMQKMFSSSEVKIRFRPSYFPFTEPSVEVDVSCFKCGGSGCSLCKQSGWIEILGAGMVHPNVLKAAGFDACVYRGFAFGVGIERITMLKYGIDDIRNFYINDLRFLKQYVKGE